MQNRLLKIAMYSIALNILFVPFNSSVAAIFGYCTILISVLYPLLRSYEAGKLKVNTLIILLAAVLLASALTSIADFQRKNLQNYIVSAVSFLSFYWALSCSEQGVGGAWLEDLYKANYILCAIFIAFSFGPFDFKYMQINQWGDTVFSMGLGNPNTVAVHVMFSLILLIMKNLSERKTLRKAINWCLILLLLVILYKLSSRTVMAATVTVLICVLLRVKKRNSLWIAYIALLVPLLIVIIQPMLSSETLGQVLGKSLETGRGSIFRFFFKTVRKNPHHYVVGRFFKYGFENYHNVPLTIMGNVGIVGLVFYIVFWAKQFKMLNGMCENKIQFVAWLALVAYMIHSASEAMMFVGTIPYGMYVIILTEIAKGNIRSKNTQITNC